MFDFLGFSFQPRVVKSRNGDVFVGFNPAVSNKAANAMRDEIRSWRMHRRSDKSLEDLSRMFNPIIRGWVSYYGSYYRSKLYQSLMPLNLIMAKRAMRKYKKLKGHQRRASRWILKIRRRSSHLFARWQLACKPMAGQ